MKSSSRAWAVPDVDDFPLVSGKGRALLKRSLEEKLRSFSMSML
jgi:hypothetical protein